MIKTILKPIEFKAQDYNVSLLHKVLAAIGLPVSSKEVTDRKGGEGTLKQVRVLQKRLKLRIDETVLLDEASILAITKHMNERGLISASRTFTVSGSVKDLGGVNKKRQQLIAFDLDLRGVSVFREVKNLAEIQKNGGFEFLGEAVSDNQGNYNITFYDWQYRRAERKLADVVVYAFDKENTVAHSRMANSEDFVTGFVRGIDLALPNKDRGIEYESLMKSLNAFLELSNTNLVSIAASRDQLSFTANELDIELSNINLAAQAALIRKKNSKLKHELLYGIGRQNISLDWTALFKKQADEISNAITKSVEESIIKIFNEREIAEFIKIIQDTASRFMLDDENTERVNTLNVMLSHALPEKKQRLSFLHAYNSFKGSEISDFWKTHLPAQTEFIDKPELISGLLLTQQLTALTGNHQMLVKEIQVNRKITSPHQLMDLDKSERVKIIEKTGLPDFIEGENDEDKMDRYDYLMQKLLNAAFPTQRIARMVDSRELSIEKNVVSQSIQSFLKENRKFDFAASNIDDFNKEINVVALENADEVKNELKKIQRVFQVSTSPDAMSTLLKNGLQSAYAIASIPRKNFINTYGKELGSKAIARAVHKRASHINTGAEMNVMNLLQFGGNTATPAKAILVEDFNKVASTLKSKVHNYEALFGSPDSYECQHCRSVFGPAAYFVDLLQFLEKQKKKTRD